MNLEVNLSKKAWHYKLQKFVFGSQQPELYSLCPYFWLTIFCIIILPIVSIFKGAAKGFDYLENKILMPKFEAWLENLNPEKIYLMYNHEEVNPPLTLKKIDRYDLFYAWRDRMLNKGYSYAQMDKIIEEGREKNYQTSMLRWEKEDAAARERNRKSKIELPKIIISENVKKKAKLFWIPIVLWTQRFFNLCLTVVISLILATIVNFLIMNFNGVEVLIVAKYVLIALLLIGLIFLFVLGVIYLIKNSNWSRLQNGTDAFGDSVLSFAILIRNFFKIIAIPFIWIINGLGKFFSLFITYFKAAKNDACPAINWDE